MTRDKPWMELQFKRPRYLVHYTDRDGRHRGAVMRRFDERLRAGDTFTGTDGLVRVVRVAESEAQFGLGHVWCEPLD